jgi:DNA-binding MarR family transcriptional regulator
MAEAKQIFAPVPARALGDDRLRGLHWKALAAIALHDRLGKNRQGCWAGNKRLAQLIGCDYSRLSATMSDLATWGYVERKPHPLNKRLRVLFVIYTDDDANVIKAKAEGDSLRTGKQSTRNRDADSLHAGQDCAETVCRDFQKVSENQWVDDVEYIPRKRGRDFPEGRKAHPAEAASPDGAAMPRGEDEKPDQYARIAAWLAQAERFCKSTEGRALSVDDVRQLRMVRVECEAIEAHVEVGDKLHGWAQRLGSDAEWQLESWEGAA